MLYLQLCVVRADEVYYKAVSWLHAISNNFTNEVIPHEQNIWPDLAKKWNDAVKLKGNVISIKNEYAFWSLFSLHVVRTKYGRFK